MNPDGSNDQCLTCGRSELPPGHKGDPDFDYSGKWIIFQAEKPGTAPGFDKLASPGSGLFNDVWMMDAAGKQFYQLTDTPSKNSGVLHPHFSHSGNQITWAQMVAPSPLPLGTWEVQIADLVFGNSGAPSINNIKSYQPGTKPGFYETHGFSMDDRSVYFCANPDPDQAWYGTNIFLFTPSTQKLVNLTNTVNQWNEHADLSPDGTKIVFVSSRGIQLVAGSEKTDYWIMDSDGSNQRRLTWFNTPGFPESQTNPVAAATSSWSPDSSTFLGYVVTDNFGNAGPIIHVDLVTPAAPVSAASFLPGPLAPASVVSLFARNMGETPVAATGLPLQTQLGTTTVTIVDASGAQSQAPLYYVSAGEVNFYLPDQVALGPAVVSVYRDGFLVARGNLTVQPVAPAIFTANASGMGVAAATYDQVVGSTQTFFNAFQCTGGVGTCSPAPINISDPNTQTYVILYGTGIRNRGGLDAVVATAGGQKLTPEYAGAQGAFVGLDQVNLLIPKTLAGSGLVTLEISVDGQSTNPVQLLFQ